MGSTYSLFLSSSANYYSLVTVFENECVCSGDVDFSFIQLTIYCDQYIIIVRYAGDVSPANVKKGGTYEAYPFIRSSSWQENE